MGKKSRSGNRDEHLGSYFQELRNNFWVKEILDADTLMRIRIRYLEYFYPGSGIRDGKIRNTDFSLKTAYYFKNISHPFYLLL
jgi:hypothetical protein